MKEIKDKGNAELKNARIAHKKAEEEASDSIQSKADADLKEKLSIIAKKAETKLNSIIKANKLEIKSLKEQYSSDSEKLQIKQDAQISDFIKKYNTELKEIESKSANRLDSLKSKYDLKVKGYKDEIASQIKDSNDETKEKMDKINADYQAKRLINKGKAAAALFQKIQEVKKNLELNNKKLIKEQERLIAKSTAKEIAALKQKFDEKVSEAKKQSIENNPNLDKIDEFEELIAELKNKLRKSLGAVAIKSVHEAYKSALLKEYLDKIFASLKNPSEINQSAESYKSEVRKIDEIIEFLSNFDLPESLSDLIENRLKQLEMRKAELVKSMKSHLVDLRHSVYNTKRNGKPQIVKSNEVKMKVNVVVIDKPVLTIKTTVKK